MQMERHLEKPYSRARAARAPLDVRPVLWLCTLLVALTAMAAHAADNVPSFSATALTGKKVNQQDLVGRPAVLILTPSRGAAEDTRKWAQALRQELPKGVRVRDVIAIDLPFFMSEADALGRAKDKIPKRYYDQTWLMSSTDLESALGVPPTSRDASVFVLDAQGRVVQRASGTPTRERVQEIRSALKSLR